MEFEILPFTPHGVQNLTVHISGFEIHLGAHLPEVRALVCHSCPEFESST